MTESQFQSWIVHERAKATAGRSNLPEEQVKEWVATLDELAESDPERFAEYEAFLNAYYHCDQGFDEAYGLVKRFGGEEADTWQSLDPEARTDLVAKFGKSQVFHPLALATRHELRRLWRHHEADWRGASVEDDDDGDAWEPTSSVTAEPDHDGDDPGDTIAAFTIDFRRFTDAEITESMARWLKEHRPADRPEPNRRGRKVRDFRVALERLGLMRLLHHHTPGEVRQRVPDAWKLYGHKAESFRREVKAAVETFHRILPFIPAHEFPKSYVRKGARRGAENHL